MIKFNNFVPSDVQYFQDTKIVIKDNFFNNPYNIVSLLKNNPPCLWKLDDKVEPGYTNYNSIKYLDQRHHINGQPVKELYDHVSSFLNKEPASTEIKSNIFRMIDAEYNDYKNNYWCPHRDDGYTMIVYLNLEEGVTGTNLYEKIKEDHPENFSEHSDPWRSKDKYNLLYKFSSKFNRAVIFEGKKFLHGMAIDNKTFFYTDRMTLTLFFK